MRSVLRNLLYEISNPVTSAKTEVALDHLHPLLQQGLRVLMYGGWVCWGLMPLSTVFQLSHIGQYYSRRKACNTTVVFVLQLNLRALAGTGIPLCSIAPYSHCV